MMGGFKGSDRALSASDAALAQRTATLTGEHVRRALAEDRLIRAGVLPEVYEPEDFT